MAPCRQGMGHCRLHPKPGAPRLQLLLRGVQGSGEAELGNRQGSSQAEFTRH